MPLGPNESVNCVRAPSRGYWRDMCTNFKMAEVYAKFVSQKISKIRWRPSEQQGLQHSNIFATGSWDNDVREVISEN